MEIRTLRRVAAAGCALAVLASPAAALAQEVRVAFVDLRKAVFNSREGRNAQEQFAKLEEAKLDQLRPRRDELRRLEEEYEKQRYVLSPEALQERRLEIVKIRRDLEREFRAAEDDLQIRQVQLLQPIQKKIARVVQEVGKDQGFTMIVDQSTEGLLFFRDSLDITEMVIQRLNDAKE
jgi:outer membrane protein